MRGTRDIMVKSHESPVDIKRLMDMLQDALTKEATSWKPATYKVPVDANLEIAPEHRNNAVRWLVQLTRKFHFLPETLALSVSILDRFLQSVKARPRHLNCIGVASFYLAAKTVEEDNVIPGTLELVQQSRCGCSVAEVLRMERCILDKLNWDLHCVSPPLHFLQVLLSLLLATHPCLLAVAAAGRQLTVLTAKLSLLLTDHHSVEQPPSMLALALLSLELQAVWPQWLAATITLQQFTGVDSGAVIQCRERVAATLQQHARGGGGSKPAKRKVRSDEEDDFYDGIKRLYNEEEMPACCKDVAELSAALAPHAMTVAN